MRLGLLDMVRCPSCAGMLETATSVPRACVRSGTLRCLRCRSTFEVANGIPRLYVDGPRWKLNAKEARGWVDLHRTLGIYDQTGVDIDFQLPYFDEAPWRTVAAHFDIALELANVMENEAVLDLGAGRGWAAKHFALRGCRAVATDIVADDQVGLGRAWALMKHSGTRFDLVIADNEQLPFRSESFNLVFCAASLHHASDLRRLLENVNRVLRSGGRLIAINEPSIGINEDPDKVLTRDAAQELAFGIKETRPTVTQYWSALDAAGFRDVRVTPVAALRPGWSADAQRPVEPTSLPASANLSLRRRLRYRRAVRLMRRVQPPRSQFDESVARMLIHGTNDVVIRAVK